MFGEFGGVREIALPGGGILCVCAGHGLESCHRCGLEFADANAFARQMDEIEVAMQSGATLDRDGIHPIGTRVRMLNHASGGVLAIRGSYYATIDPDPTFRYDADCYILQCVPHTQPGPTICKQQRGCGHCSLLRPLVSHAIAYGAHSVTRATRAIHRASVPCASVCCVYIFAHNVELISEHCPSHSCSPSARTCIHKHTQRPHFHTGRYEDTAADGSEPFLDEVEGFDERYVHPPQCSIICSIGRFFFFFLYGLQDALINRTVANTATRVVVPPRSLTPSVVRKLPCAVRTSTATHRGVCANSLNGWHSDSSTSMDALESLACGTRRDDCLIRFFMATEQECLSSAFSNGCLSL
jgi:hypothetical protein